MYSGRTRRRYLDTWDDVDSLENHEACPSYKMVESSMNNNLGQCVMASRYILNYPDIGRNEVASDGVRIKEPALRWALNLNTQTST